MHIETAKKPGACSIFFYQREALLRVSCVFIVTVGKLGENVQVSGLINFSSIAGVNYLLLVLVML